MTAPSQSAESVTGSQLACNARPHRETIGRGERAADRAPYGDFHNPSKECPHWGYVLKGRLTVRSGDSEEVFEAGDAYYLSPGHVGVSNEPDTEIVQFSPAQELKKTSEVIMQNMQAGQGG